MDGKLLTFLGISMVIIVTPGPDMAMVTKNALGRGQRGALLTTLGIGSALLVHATAAALGLSALLHSASGIYTVVKLCGAAYLVILGIRTLWSTRSAGVTHLISGSGEQPATTARHSSPYLQGFLSAILNPKLIVFFATFLPQFVESARPLLPQMLLLGAIFDIMGMIWLVSYGLFVTRAHAFFNSSAVRRRMERMTGVVLVALGARVALERS